jgi:hypothetical protein
MRRRHDQVLPIFYSLRPQKAIGFLLNFVKGIWEVEEVFESSGVRNMFFLGN